jgi:hypothetical protein
LVSRIVTGSRAAILKLLAEQGLDVLDHRAGRLDGLPQALRRDIMQNLACLDQALEGLAILDRYVRITS